MLHHGPARQRRLDSEHLLLLKGLLVAVLVAFAVLSAWHYGLVQRVWRDDMTGMSIVITVVFALASIHGALHLLRLSRALNHVGEVERRIACEGGASAADPRAPAGLAALPQGCVARHIRKLLRKASLSGGALPVTQHLLLESFEAELRQGHEISWFAADLLLMLGLLGTVVGFILMLSPIGALDGADYAAVRSALAAMSNGMAVALYTTLTGLIGGMLLKVEGLLLDEAVQELVRRTTDLVEIYVLPSIDQGSRHATAA